MPFVDLAGIGELAGVHQLDAVVFGQRLGGLGGGSGCLLPLVRVAIGVDLALIAALDVVATEVDHLLVGGDSLGGFVLLAIDDCRGGRGR